MEIPASYKWLHTNLLYRAVARVLYTIAAAVGFFWSICVMHTKVVNRKAFRECKGKGYFLYGNHTQVIGDVFTPARYIAPTRLFAVVSAANLGIPVIGKILPMLGALVVPRSLDEMSQLLNAIDYHLKHKRCIVIYPEAHVWPYCSFIRPFPATSFRFPVMYNAPSFCMTTVYHRRRIGKKPKATVYIDGPFYARKDVKPKEAQKILRDEIYECMSKRAKSGTYEYVRYTEQKVTK